MFLVSNDYDEVGVLIILSNVHTGNEIQKSKGGNSFFYNRVS